MKEVEEKSSSSSKLNLVMVISTKAVTIPAAISKDHVLIKTNVIQNDPPLLLSKDSRKKSR